MKKIAVLASFLKCKSTIYVESIFVQNKIPFWAILQDQKYQFLTDLCKMQFK